MPIVQYQYGDSGVLESLAAKLPAGHNLRYPDFVNYYYGTSTRCRLWLSIDNSDQILGVLGSEDLRFDVYGESKVLGFGSNFTSFQPGAGALLFLHWLKSCDHGVLFGGSADSQRIVRQQRWDWYSDTRQFYLNRASAKAHDEGLWRRLARWALRYIERDVDPCARARELASNGSLSVEASEEQTFSQDMLPAQSPFRFRFLPSIEHLNWRYNTQLGFVRYRLFRIVSAGESSGYVVLNVQPDRILVAQCDGDDPILLCQGIFVALAAVAGRQRKAVFLTSSHPIMKKVFLELGFRVRNRDYPFAMGGLNGPPQVPKDAKEWLVNFDWGDNGLRAPFLGQQAI